MQKPASFFVGPELAWIIYYIAVLVIMRITHSPAKQLDSFWISLAYIIPLILLPLTFAVYFIPVVPHKLLLLRMWIAGLVGCHFVLGKALLAHSEQGPGVGTAYMMGMGFAIFALIACSIWALIKF
jgi:hypothetical protein